MSVGLWSSHTLLYTVYSTFDLQLGHTAPCWLTLELQSTQKVVVCSTSYSGCELEQFEQPVLPASHGLITNLTVAVYIRGSVTSLLAYINTLYVHYAMFYKESVYLK